MPAPFVKICGFRDEDSAALAIDAGVDAIGFVLVPSRPRRYIAPAEAARILRRLGPARRQRVQVVTVFLDQPLAEVQEAIELVQPDWVQLHGNEPPAYCRALDRPVIKAFRVASHGDAQRWPQAAASYKGVNLAFHLLDAAWEGRSGGTGRTFPWRWLAAVEPVRPFLLAGGLDAANVQQAVAEARPDGVDVSSGVETEGRKDPAKIEAFLQAARRWKHERAAP